MTTGREPRPSRRKRLQLVAALALLIVAILLATIHLSADEPAAVDVDPPLDMTPSPAPA